MNTLETFNHYFSHVNVTERFDVSLNKVVYFIHPIWKHVDRPDVSGFGTTNRKLVPRMKKAIESGQIFYKVELRVDVRGKSYISTFSRVFMRSANRDLKRLDF